MKVHAGLVFMTNHPKFGKSAILRVRGVHSRDWKVEPYPGSCQLTLQAKFEEGKDYLTPLEAAAHATFGIEIVITHDALINLNYSKKELRLVKNYGMFVPFESLRRMRSSIFDWPIRFVTEHHLSKIQSVERYNPQVGIQDSTVIAMFPDEIKALRIAFKKFHFAT